MNGNSPDKDGSSFGAVENFTRNFSSMKSKSVEASLTEVEGDETKLIAGKTNKSSSLMSQWAPPTIYSVKKKKLFSVSKVMVKDENQG